MKIIVIILIILLGLNILRFIGGAAYMLNTSKIPGTDKHAGFWTKLTNTAEAIGLVVVYLILVVSYYSK